MAQLPIPQGQVFDATQVEPNKAFDPVPPGWYNVKIAESEMKPTADGTGQMLVLILEVVDGEHVGRKLYDRLNLQNANPLAQDIAWKTLSAICHATGVIQLNDSSQLHGIPIKAKVTVKPAGPGKDGTHYDAGNDVKGYKSASDVPMGATGPAGGPPWGGATSTAPAAAAPSGAAPWQQSPPPPPVVAAPPPPPPPPPAPDKFPPEAIAWAQANPTHAEAAPIIAWMREREAALKPTPAAAPWAKAPVAAVAVASNKPPWAK